MCTHKHHQTATSSTSSNSYIKTTYHVFRGLSQTSSNGYIKTTYPGRVGEGGEAPRDGTHFFWTSSYRICRKALIDRWAQALLCQYLFCMCAGNGATNRVRGLCWDCVGGSSLSHFGLGPRKCVRCNFTRHRAHLGCDGGGIPSAWANSSG